MCVLQIDHEHYNDEQSMAYFKNRPLVAAYIDGNATKNDKR